MTDLWYDNPKILLSNLDEFIPDKHLKFNNKINSIVRFGIYYAFLIILLNSNINYLYITLLLIIISYYLGIRHNNEKFINSPIDNIDKCTKPTENNPFMNYTLGNLIDNNNKNKACNYDDVKDEIRSNFRKDIYTDSSDLWGKYISDRNFYTMPNTEIVNDQTGFAEWLYGGGGKCKTTGNDCLKHRDPTYNRGRITTEVDDNIIY